MSIHSDDLANLADEYVLGLLSETEAGLLEEVMARDPALAARVGFLRDQLLPLDLTADARRPPEGFVAALDERLARHGSVERRAAPGSTVSAPIARSAAPAKWRWLPAGRLVAATVGLAVGVVVGIAAGWFQPTPEPVVIAVLLDAEGVPTAVIEDFGQDRARVRFVADVEIPPGRALQAWTLPSQERGPTSLGVMSEIRPTFLQGLDLPTPVERQLYEITLEPAGGSPTGRPTGPVLGIGYAALQN
ncbi:anti-sigma factor [Acuticoccus kandeliae]|uniref:anti-sigma factor n=1 Tax=Acuticoccus kandeliae TaxID=2073160 RepID=UPI00196B3729|nr:anti-sigma factor [Acuticoccus kandeliae]